MKIKSLEIPESTILTILVNFQTFHTILHLYVHALPAFLYLAQYPEYNSRSVNNHYHFNGYIVFHYIDVPVLGDLSVLCVSLLLPHITFHF